MKEIKELKPTYKTCDEEGFYNVKRQIDYELIESLLKNSLENISNIDEIEKIMENKHSYSFLFTLYYDVLRKLLDTILLFDKIKCSNHQCINAYICTKHNKLDFDWEILETLRLLRNGINYEARKITKDLWKEHKLKFKIYIKSLIKIVKEQLKTS